MKKIKSEIVFSNIQLIILLLLRIVIGWHFLYEGLIKLFNPNWTAASYLKYSNWIFADLFHAMAENPTILSIVDFCNIWGLILVGLALIFGVLTKYAALGGAALLLLYYVANPPFTLAESMKEGSYMIVDKNLVEMIALIFIAFLPTPSFIPWTKLKVFIQTKILHKDIIPPEQLYPCQQTAKEEREILERRGFLYNLISVPIAGTFTAVAAKTKAFSKPLDSITGATTLNYDFLDISALKGDLPQTNMCGIELSRLIMGCNLIGGWAHSRDLHYVGSLVKKYHTQEKVFETFALGEKCGVNAIIINTALTPLMTAYWKETRGNLKFISDCAGVGSAEKGIELSCDAGASACYIQGETTDKILRDGGSFEIVGEWLEMIRKRGVPAGIGAHSIGVFKECVKLGLKPDFWVKTIHHHNYWSARHPEENDNVWCRDPEGTIEFMRTLEEPWIGFKVMAAGAIRPEDGFKYAYENGADIICAGMYDFQIVEDVNIASEILAGPLERERPWRC